MKRLQPKSPSQNHQNLLSLSMCGNHVRAVCGARRKRNYQNIELSPPSETMRLFFRAKYGENALLLRTIANQLSPRHSLRRTSPIRLGRMRRLIFPLRVRRAGVHQLEEISNLPTRHGRSATDKGDDGASHATGESNSQLFANTAGALAPAASRCSGLRGIGEGLLYHVKSTRRTSPTRRGSLRPLPPRS